MNFIPAFTVNYDGWFNGISINDKTNIEMKLCRSLNPGTSIESYVSLIKIPIDNGCYTTEIINRTEEKELVERKIIAFDENVLFSVNTAGKPVYSFEPLLEKAETKNAFVVYISTKSGFISEQYEKEILLNGAPLAKGSILIEEEAEIKPSVIAAARSKDDRYVEGLFLLEEGSKLILLFESYTTEKEQRHAELVNVGGSLVYRPRTN